MGQTVSPGDRQSQTIPSTFSPTSIPDAFGLLEFAHGVDADIDIVALHGLDGHRENSWTADNGVLWLRDLLPSKIPNARILSYGYDVNTRGQDQLSTASLHTHAVSLIAHLASKRKSTSTEERPIIFVAHSLGGILLKYALLYAHSCGQNNLPSYKAVEVSTCGVLFFGTPHQGSKGADLGSTVLNVFSAFGKATTGIVKNIRTDSEALQQQQIQYQAISSNYETKFYFETYKTPVGPFTKLLLVPQSSAVVPGAVNAEMIPLNRDHVNMVKFQSAADGTFQLVSSHISSMVAEGPQKIVDRWKSHRPVKDDSRKTILKADPAPLPMLPYQEAGISLIGRGHALSWIYETFKNHRKIVLYGIGGIGKTAIAVEYIYTHRHDYDITFWVNGDTLETTTSGFIAIAQQLVNWKSKYSTTGSSRSDRDYPGAARELGLDDFLDSRGKVSNKTEDRPDVVIAVKEWLSRVKSGNWLMVFDNVDDLDSFDLATFFPIPLVGQILVTSRKQESCALGTGYEVTALSQDDGVKLLIEKSRRGDAGSEAHQIVRILESLPLAIELAGVYIAALQLSFESYLTANNESWKDIFAQNIRPYGRSLVSAWEVSYQAIEARSPHAADLLLICAFLGSEDIPEQLFQGKFGVANHNEALRHLFAFSLAKRGPTDTSFSIHPLVQAWARERLDEDQKAAKVTEMVIILGDTISQMPLSWNHTLIIANYALQYCLPKLQANSDISIFQSLERIAEREGGKLLQAMFRMALDATGEVKGPDSTQTFTAMELLGRSYFCNMGCPVGQFLQNSLRMAEKYPSMDGIVTFPRLEPIKKRLSENPDAERSMAIMEQRLEGEKLVRCALEGRERIQGPDHVDTLSTIHLLAYLMWAERRFGEAEELERRALEGREKALGLHHNQTLKAINNLAVTMHEQGRFAEAETLHRRALQGLEGLLGPNHTDTLQSVNSLGVSIHRQGHFAEAETLKQRALEGREKLLGSNHADTLFSFYSLALSIHAQGRFGEAEKLYRRALEGREKLLGSNHADTLKSVHEMAISIHAQGRFDEAEKLHRRALEGREDLLGPNHADTFKSVQELAVSIHAQGRFEEAEKLKRHALEGREKLQGLNHLDTLWSAESLAVSLWAQGRYTEAEILERRVLEGYEKLLGPNHAGTLETLHNLAQIVYDQGRFDEAEQLGRRAVQGREEILGLNHNDFKVSGIWHCRYGNKVVLRQL